MVKTEADGRYTLPIDEESVIFVIKPAGYAVPVDEEMLPRFYYIHQPAGSPQDLNLRYRGIDRTGQLPASVDFALTKTVEPQKFDVIVFADPQPESALEVDFIRDDVVNALIGSSAAFGMTIGDIMYDDLSLYPRLNRIIGQIGLPWYNIGGNHDLNYEAPSAKYSRETFKRIYGPAYYAPIFFLRAGVRVMPCSILGPRPSRSEFAARQWRARPPISRALASSIWVRASAKVCRLCAPRSRRCRSILMVLPHASMI